MRERELTLADLEDEEFQRQLQQEFGALSPEERAEFEALVAQANEALPAMNASLDRMLGRMREMATGISDVKASVSRLNARLDKIETRLGEDFDGWKPDE
jgi:predicted  nucleic acid-binding Zn-ribbon protein